MNIKAKNEGENSSQLYTRTRFFLEMGMALAISGMFVLLLGVLRIPASIPIFFLTYRRSPRVAIYTAIIVGYLVLIVHPLILHPIVFIESPIEYVCIALAGYFPMGNRIFGNKVLQWIYDCRGIIISSFLRFGVTLVGSFIIYSYYFKSSGPLIWLIAFLDEGPIFVPYLIFVMVLIPSLVRFKFDVKELK